MKRSYFNMLTGCRAEMSKIGQRVAVGLLVTTLGLVTVSAPLNVAATPICGSSTLGWTIAMVYLFNSNENNTPVPSPEATIIEGEVYTDTGTHFVGMIDGSYNIIDANNNIVGYVIYLSHD